MVWFGNEVHVPRFFSYHVRNLLIHTPALIINESQTLLCVACHPQVHAESAREAFMLLIRPAKPWDKCTMTAASPAVPAVRLIAHMTVQMHRNITQGR